MFHLLTKPEYNAKLAKALDELFAQFALHLAPADLSGREVCPRRSPGCTQGCLNTSGRAGHAALAPAIHNARLLRTKLYFAGRDEFMLMLHDDIMRAHNWAVKKGLQLTVRLNATSDIPWHRVPYPGADNIMAAFPDIQFYDYTKVSKRLLKEQLPPNYHLTFSLSETNESEAAEVLASGHNVAVVFRDKKTLARAIERGYSLGGIHAPVIDGDKNDLRFRDPKGAIVGLNAKGKAKQDASGWVRDL